MEGNPQRETLRTKICDTIESVSGSVPLVDEDGWPTGDEEITIEGIEFTAGTVADAVIAYLWREAMKPEAIAAMAKALWVADDKPDVGHGSDGCRMEAEHHIRLVMNLILGPNPNEQEISCG